MISSSAENLRRAIEAASSHLVERAALVESVALAMVAGEHLLVIGPPGTAKSEAVRRMARTVGGSYFEYLLGRFTEPSEIFGPVDLRKLREGIVETQTDGMLPEAQIAFLDEIFQGSTAILNTLLGLLNERTFRRGHSQLKVPLRACVAASNALPDDPNLNAFADRFLLRQFVEAVPDPQLEDLLAGGWQMSAPIESVASLEDVDILHRAALNLDMAPVRSHLAQAIRLLRGSGIEFSDRRAVKVQKLIAAATVLDGRTTPSQADLWPLIYAVPTRETQETAREVLREMLAFSRSATLPFAAEESSQGPQARALRLGNAVRDLFAIAEAERDGGWKLKLEGIAREIDAAFSGENVPSELGEWRTKIVAALS